MSHRLSVIGDGADVELASGPASVNVIASSVPASTASEMAHPDDRRAAAS